MIDQAALNQANAEFWNEICGSSLITGMGMTIKEFDAKYLAFYPWLEATIRRFIRRGERLLEVGPGYGTVGRIAVDCGCDYTAIDIAPNVISHTLQHTSTYAQLGSVLELDSYFSPGSFDAVIAIGSLHHTGDIPQALSQIHQALAEDGRLLAMLYGDGNVHDYNKAGQQAPHTDITPLAQIPLLFSDFTVIEVLERRPHDHTDIYVTATKG